MALAGIARLAAIALDPTSTLAVLLAIVLVGCWRLLAMHDSLAGLGVDPPSRQRGRAVLVALAVVVVVTHGWAAYGAWSVLQAASRVFVADAPPDAKPMPSSSHGLDEDYLATPFATPETADSRVNVLLIGVDSSESGTHALTDTMLVVSADPRTGSISMVSFPRDIADFPLWNGGTYHGKINSFMTWARNHPEDYPDGPLGSLARELGFLLGVPVQYYAAVDLAGFGDMIDAVGGVTIDNPMALNDPTYGWLDGRHGFSLSVGVHALDGETALAYVRTRKSPGDSDFGRARRQQQVLLALREKLMSPALLVRLPEIAAAVGEMVRTNFPSDRIGEFIELSQGLDGSDVRQVVLGPPYAQRAVGAGVTDYRLHLDMDLLEALSIDLFGQDSRYAASG